jgi:hypothetical protein
MPSPPSSWRQRRRDSLSSYHQRATIKADKTLADDAKNIDGQEYTNFFDKAHTETKRRHDIAMLSSLAEPYVERVDEMVALVGARKMHSLQRKPSRRVDNGGTTAERWIGSERGTATASTGGGGGSGGKSLYELTKLKTENSFKEKQQQRERSFAGVAAVSELSASSLRRSLIDDTLRQLPTAATPDIVSSVAFEPPKQLESPPPRSPSSFSPSLSPSLSSSSSTSSRKSSRKSPRQLRLHPSRTQSSSPTSPTSPSTSSPTSTSTSTAVAVSRAAPLTQTALITNNSVITNNSDTAVTRFDNDRHRGARTRCDASSLVSSLSQLAPSKTKLSARSPNHQIRPFVPLSSSWEQQCAAAAVSSSALPLLSSSGRASSSTPSTVALREAYKRHLIDKSLAASPWRLVVRLCSSRHVLLL